MKYDNIHIIKALIYEFAEIVIASFFLLAQLSFISINITVL